MPKSLLKQNEDKKRYTWFMLELYVEKEWIEVFDSLLFRLEELNYSYCYICHDRDKFYNGHTLNPIGFLIGANYNLSMEDCVDFKKGLKKSHIHLIVHTDCQFTCSAFGKHIGFNSRWIEGCKDYVASLRYLIHLDHKDKYQYSKKLVEHGDNLYAYDKFLNFIERDNNAHIDQADVSLEIFDLIDCRAEIVTYSEIFKYCALKGKQYDAWLVRHQGAIRTIILEHNARFEKEKD